MVSGSDGVQLLDNSNNLLLECSSVGVTAIKPFTAVDTITAYELATFKKHVIIENNLTVTGSVTEKIYCEIISSIYSVTFTNVAINLPLDTIKLNSREFTLDTNNEITISKDMLVSINFKTTLEKSIFRVV